MYLLFFYSFDYDSSDYLSVLRWTSLDHIGIGVSVVLAAMPAPSTCAMLANKYDKNPEFASKLIFVSTAFSLVTLPFISFIITL